MIVFWYLFAVTGGLIWFAVTAGLVMTGASYLVDRRREGMVTLARFDELKEEINNRLRALEDKLPVGPVGDPK